MKLAALVVIAACYQPFEPVTVKAPENAFAKAQRVLADKGYSIEDKDEAAGFVTTKWDESESMGGKIRLRWHVTISDGEVTVDSQCQSMVHKPIGADEWDDCDKQPNGRNDKAKALAGAMTE